MAGVPGIRTGHCPSTPLGDRPRRRSGTESLKYELQSTKYVGCSAFYGWQVCQGLGRVTAPRLRSGTGSLKYELQSTKYGGCCAFYGWQVCRGLGRVTAPRRRSGTGRVAISLASASLGHLVRAAERGRGPPLPKSSPPAVLRTLSFVLCPSYLPLRRPSACATVYSSAVRHIVLE